MIPIASDLLRNGSRAVYLLTSKSTSQIRLYSMAAVAFDQKVKSQLEDIREAGTWKAERVITTPQAAAISIENRADSILNFCANNYLGLSSHPSVVNAGKKAIDDYGSGLSSGRINCGTQVIHIGLENKIAQFHQREAAILYASCFDANTGIFEVILGEGDTVISDELNHASIIDGIRLCKARKFRYKHRDMQDLESKLAESKDSPTKLIVTDGVFSMDGSIAPLRQICDLADKYGAMVFVDECHATGFLGKTGRGTEEFLDVMGRVDIINSTLGKALGGAAGGYTCGSESLVTLLRQCSRPYIFSNSLPPPVVGCASKVFDILLHTSELTQKLQENTARFRSKMKIAGFNLIGDSHPICPVMLGDARLATDFSNAMLEKDIYVVGFSFPVVPKGKARIRVQISAAHSTEQIDRCVEAFIEVGKQLGVIS